MRKEKVTHSNGPLRIQLTICGATEVISQYSIMSFLIRSNREFVSKAVDPSCHIQRALAVSLTHKKEGNHILEHLPFKDSSYSMCSLHVLICLLVLVGAEFFSQ